MITVINFADENFKKQQKYNTKSAYKFGAHKVIEYSPKDIDIEFIKKYSHIFSQKRGFGYWLWKPYIILKTLEKINYGDYLFYCDSSAYFVNKIQYLIDTMIKDKQDILAFELPLIERQWTKRDAFILMGCDKEEFVNSNQILSGYILVKKNDFTLNFFREYFNFCKDYRILTDSPNELGYENYSDFIDHRHDQSIFSLLCKKYGIKPHRDPSQFGTWPNKYITNGRDYKINKYDDTYPQILVSCRKDYSIEFKVKEFIRRKIKFIPFIYYMFKRGIYK